MHGFTISLARENAGFGITVNTISPGYVATDMVMAVPEDGAPRSSPTSRPDASASEIAYGVSFRGRGSLVDHRQQPRHQRRPPHGLVSRAGRRGMHRAPADGHAAQHANPCCAT
jgi:NAD(P)-dependent dehydrogenase (short-subunit alcohol dehydrogenase family)